MNSVKVRLKTVAFDSLMFLIALLIQYNSLFLIKIYGANPMLPLCVLIVVSMFSSELYSFFFGFIVGAFADSVSGIGFGFNTISFMLAAFATAFIVHYIFNNNVRSAIALSIIVALFYFALRWLFSSVFGHSVTDSFVYLYRNAIPSTVYTAVITVPLYLLKKKFTNSVKQ